MKTNHMDRQWMQLSSRPCKVATESPWSSSGNSRARDAISDNMRHSLGSTDCETQHVVQSQNSTSIHNDQWWFKACISASYWYLLPKADEHLPPSLNWFHEANLKSHNWRPWVQSSWPTTFLRLRLPAFIPIRNLKPKVCLKELKSSGTLTSSDSTVNKPAK